MQRKLWRFMTMNGLMSKYKNSLKNTPKPILPSKLLKARIDLKGLMSYAKNKHISPSDLTEQEKKQFVFAL